MRMPTAAGDLLPAGTAFIAMATIFSRPPLSWTLGDKTKKRTVGQPSTSLLLPAGGSLSKRNQGKLWCLIPAVVQVAHAATRFWEGDTCAFLVDGFVWMVRWYLRLERFVERTTWNIIFKGRQEIRYTVHIAVDRYFPEANLVRGILQS